MRAAITRADDARSDDAHQVRATNVVDAAQTAATDHLAAADAWETRWRPTRRHRRATAGAGPHWPTASGTAGRAKRRRRGSVRRRGRRPVARVSSQASTVAGSMRLPVGAPPTTRRHPPDQLIHAIRAALLSTIQAKCQAAGATLWYLPP